MPLDASGLQCFSIFSDSLFGFDRTHCELGFLVATIIYSIERLELPLSSHVPRSGDAFRLSQGSPVREKHEA